MVRCLLIACLSLGCGSSNNNPAIDSGGADTGVADAPVDADPPRARLIYVSDNSDSELAVVELGVDGTMTAMTNLDVALPGAPSSLAYGRTTRRLYVGMNGAIATLDLDAGGTPTLQAMTTTNANTPTYIGMFESDSVIATAYFGQGEIRTHGVSGVAPHQANATLSTTVQPHAAFPGPGGRIYVPHRDADTTQWFTINNDGDPVFASELAAEAGSGPRHIAFTPDGAFAYVVNEMGNSVSSHTVAGDGSLSRFETVPAIANPVAGTDTGADIHVTPDGQFVYASIRGRNVIAMFSIANGGGLSSLGTVDTEATPREFDVSPDGRFAVVCGQGTGFLQSYRIEADGTLTSVDRLQVGTDLRWAIID